MLSPVEYEDLKAQLMALQTVTCPMCHSGTVVLSGRWLFTCPCERAAFFRVDKQKWKAVERPAPMYRSLQAVPDPEWTLEEA